ncbi:hypothetical protein [Streptomyces purpureus]|uniref:hypothetical protein n=1 Tax=Streptomyces purpureus TaxID=1951 RepID=UPI00036F0921|nr:hypothetical protein [Streptomyces purpureus]
MTTTTTGVRADCTARATGEISFTITDGAGDLVLKLRDGDEELRLETGPDGTAVLPAGTELAEGRWDLFADERPVEAGIRDVRELVDRRPGSGDRVAVRIPYPTAEGRLAVRAWLRAPHAEAGDLTFTEAGCTVEGRLYGTVAGPGAVAEARHDGRVHRVEATCIDGVFSVTLPYGPLAEEPLDRERLWELWLRPAEDAESVRISRILDDLWDRRNVFVYPVTAVGDHRATPCYTADNDLCVRVTP